MATRPRPRWPVQEAYEHWLREGWPPAVAGNLTAFEMSEQKLEAVADGWTPQQVATVLFLRWAWETDRSSG